MMIKIALRSILRNPRRSLTTSLTIGIGAAAMLIFAAYSLYDVYVLQTTTIERGGHLTVFRKGYFDFGSGDPAIWGVGDYPRVIRPRMQAQAVRGPFSPPASCPPTKRGCIIGTNTASAKIWRVRTCGPTIRPKGSSALVSRET